MTEETAFALALTIVALALPFLPDQHQDMIGRPSPRKALAFVMSFGAAIAAWVGVFIS